MHDAAGSRITARVEAVLGMMMEDMAVEMTHRVRRPRHVVGKREEQGMGAPACGI